MTMGSIDNILAEVRSLTDRDLQILMNRIMELLNPENAQNSPTKIVPRMECPVCHTNVSVVKNGHKQGRHFCAGHAESRLLQQVTHFCLAYITAVMSGRPSLLTRLWAYPMMTQEMDLIFSISGSAIPASSL